MVGVRQHDLLRGIGGPVVANRLPAAKRWNP